MNKMAKIMSFILVLILMITSYAFAGEKFLFTRSYKFRKESQSNNDTYVSVYIGQKDVSRYEDDDYIRISPKPVDTYTNDVGNMYAKFELSEAKNGAILDISIERVYEALDYEMGPNVSSRTSSTVNGENERYTMPEKGIESNEQKILLKAKELTANLNSQYRQAKAIFEYVSENMKYANPTTRTEKSALSTLSSMTGDCEDYAILYAALCRSLEIPTKVVIGYRVKKVADTPKNATENLDGTEPVKYKYELEPHAWNEVYFDEYGWVPVDTCNFYVTKNNTINANPDAFGKINAAEYIVDGSYINGALEYEYHNNYKLINNSLKLEPFTEDKRYVQHSFQDIGNYAWAEDSINTLYAMNVIKGYSDTEYGPAGNISRIEFITMLARVLKNLDYTPSTYLGIYYYPDYDQNHYSKREYDFLMRCLEDYYPANSYSAGYYAMNNIFGNTLYINKAITRGEVVALMEPFLKRSPDYDSYKFKDVVGNNFQAAIIKAATNGLIMGYEDGTFKPNKSITRAEIAVIMDRYIGVKSLIF